MDRAAACLALSTVTSRHGFLMTANDIAELFTEDVAYRYHPLATRSSAELPSSQRGWESPDLMRPQRVTCPALIRPGTHQSRSTAT